MGNFTIALLGRAMQDEYSLAKALAHFMFREIIEDIHAEGRISDAEMRKLNKEACNRAELFVQKIMPNEDMMAAFMIESANCTGWDAPEMTEKLQKKYDFYDRIASELYRIRKG